MAAKLLLVGVVVLAGGWLLVSGLGGLDGLGRLGGLAGGGPALASVTAQPATVPGCLPAEATVALDGDAPGGGAVVEVEAASPAVEVPARVTVPAGRSRQVFAVQTRPVAVAERVELRASLGGATVASTVEIVPVEAAALGADPSPACLAGFTEQHGYGRPQRAGAFDAGLVGEASGLAASRRNPGWLYLVDDQAPREVWALRSDGSDLRAIPLGGTVGRDVEALAVGPCSRERPEPCVYVGDIGDNLLDQPDVGILRFPEPDLSAAVQQVTPEQIRVRYPGGPVDAEALLVDDAGALYIVTNDAGEGGVGAARLLRAEGFADTTLTDLGAVDVPEPNLPMATSVLGLLVTGGDYAHGRVLLRTYDSVVEYVAPEPDAPLAGFPSWPVREVPAAGELQSEAVAWAADGCGYYTVGERVGDLWFVSCRAGAPPPR